MNCAECKANRRNPEVIQFAVHEAHMARNERIIKRLIVSNVISYVLLFCVLIFYR